MDASRRRFLGGRRPSPATRAQPFRPPWSVAEGRFLDLCTRCADCLKACPTGLLQPGEGGYPVADFAEAACTYCGDCARACATGAIQSDITRKPWSFGITVGEDCLPRQNVECRVCGEICDVGAIRFRPRAGGVPLPEVDNAVCNGCGACLAPCPVSCIQRIPLPVEQA